MAKKMTKQEFTNEHAQLKQMFKDVKQALRHVHKLTKPLVKKARKLYKQGNSLYLDTEQGTVPSFKALPKLMDDLEFWQTLDIDLTF